jgi:hypothetical protein
VGLPWCQPTCPVCQWQATLFDLGAPGPTTALNAGRWAGDPRRASYHTHVAGPAPFPPQGRHVAAPDPSPEGGGPGPRSRHERSGPRWSGHHTWWPRTSLGSPGPRGLPESSLPSRGKRRSWTLESSGRVRRPWSQLSGLSRTPRHPEGVGEVTHGDTLRVWTP